jgi:hypothetical protein
MGHTFSSDYKAKMRRIKRLPDIAVNAMFGALKKDALGLIKIFHDGIKNNDLGLEELSPFTVSKKKFQGMSKPKSPLYGRGDEKLDRSYSNMLRMRKLKNGWKVYPSWAKHHESKLQLRQLFKIHEMGATFKRGETTVRIPPRPAFLLSYRKWMAKKKDDETGKQVRKAITEYVNKGTSRYVDEYLAILGRKESEGA